MNARRKRGLVRAAIFLGVVFIASVSGALVRTSSFGSVLELKSYDYRFSFRGPSVSPDPPITILAIDEPSFDRIPEPLMLWHRHFAEVISGLVRSGAAVVAVDFVFSDVAAMDAAGQEALSGAILEAGQAGVPLVLGYRNRSSGVEQPPDSIRLAALAVGHTFAYLNLTTDIDDFVRRQELGAAREGGEPEPGLALAVANAYRKASTPQTETILINYREPGHYVRESFYRALEAVRGKDDQYLRDTFGGRIVLIGRVGKQGDEDLHSTPHYYWGTPSPAGTGRRTAGIEIHASTIATLLNGSPIRRLTSLEQNTINSLVVILLTLCCLALPVLRASLTSALILLVVFNVSFFTAFRSDIWMDVVSPVAAGVLAFGLAQTANFVFEGREKRRLRGIFSGYVNDRVIEKILGDSDRVLLTGTRKPVAVLFADIKGFTTRSEAAAAEDVVHMLNQYFTGIIDAIQLHSGTVNSLIGDGLMAIFGAPLDDPDSARHAIDAAREMQKALVEVNRLLKSQHAEPIEIGIGIHYGEAIVGNMGSPRKMEYTAIGDVVNTASRVEGLTRKIDAQILITGETFAAAGKPAEAEYAGDFEVKGRTSLVSIYRVPFRI